MGASPQRSLREWLHLLEEAVRRVQVPEKRLVRLRAHPAQVRDLKVCVRHAGTYSSKSLGESAHVRHVLYCLCRVWKKGIMVVFIAYCGYCVRNAA